MGIYRLNIRRVIGITVFTLVVISLSCQYTLLLGNEVTNLNLVVPHSASPIIGEPTVELYNTLNNSLGEISITQIINLSTPIFTAPSHGSLNPTANLTHGYDGPDKVPTPIKTIRPASYNHAIGSDEGKDSEITIRINQTVFWRYNSSTPTKLVGFQPPIESAKLVQLYINSTIGSSKFNPVNASDFYTSSGGMFYYNFTQRYNSIPNGAFHLKYEYDANFPVTSWKVQSLAPTSGDGYHYLVNQTTDFTQSFTLNVTLGRSGGPHFDGRFLIKLPDTDDVYAPRFEQYAGMVPNATFHNNVTQGNTIEFRSNLMNAQTVAVGISFKAEYIAAFLNTIDGNEKWVEDRLVKGFTLRERDYKLKILSGPSHLAATHLKFNESLIYYSDISKSSFNSSLIRTIKIANMNRSTVEYPEGTDSAYVIVGYRAEGITVLGEDYFLFKDEVDLVTISYAAAGNLKLVITDSIRNPLASYKVNLFLTQRKYGSLMNFESIVPYPTKTSDNKGIIEIKHVPRGNYTVQILNPQGVFIQNQTADTALAINFLVTPVKHFPTVILIYSGIFTSILLIGIIIYRKSSPQ